MSRVNWKKLVKQIPSRVQIAPKVYYDVVWSKDLVDTKGNYLYGITDLTNRIITIRMDMSPKLTVETYFHELLHCYSEEFKINLTETQVLRLEHILPYVLKKDNLFKNE
jgi:hypothetical protein